MPLTHDQSAFRSECSKALMDVELLPGDPRYVEMFGRMKDVDDPVELLKAEIKDSGSESMQFLSGFRGSGKTTQLRRLQASLESDPDGEDVVLYADALEYFSPAEPLEITQFLLGLAGAFGETTSERFGTTPLHEGYLTRFREFIKNTEIEVSEGKLGVSTGGPLAALLGGMNANAELKAALRQTPSFVQKVNALLRDRLSQLRTEVETFIAGCLDDIRRKRGKQVRITFLFDQLEQIRATSGNAAAVIDSFRRLFSHHRELIRFSGVHLVYAVPPWLPFALPGFGGLVPIPSIKCWRRGSHQSECPEGVEILREVLRRRLGAKNIARLFGTPEGEFPQGLQRIVDACGGDLRGLLRLARGILRRTNELPVSASAVDRTLSNARAEFAILADDEAVWLNRVATTNTACLTTRDEASIHRFSLFLDAYFIVCFRNGEEWYDLHPLVRENVAAVMRRIEEEKRATAAVLVAASTPSPGLN